ncbi:MAG: GNAT family N-acetyltransferase [Massilia sp.]
MSEQLSITHCAPGDEHALALVGQATFLETFAGILSGKAIVSHCLQAHAAGIYRDWLADSAVRIWLAAVAPDQAPVGYLVLAPAQLPLDDLAEGELEIKRIYCLRRFQGGGLGKRMLNAALEHARAQGAPRVLLGVYANNAEAIAFYRHHGFEIVGARTFNVGGTTYHDHIMGRRL